MRTLKLSDLVDEKLASSVVSNLKVVESRHLKLSDLVNEKLTPSIVSNLKVVDSRHFKLKVPDELTKLYTVPEDINDFIDKIHPNMDLLVRAKGIVDQDVSEVINNFIVYLLDKDGNGSVRYNRYDPIKYPDQPFFKWYLCQLKFFVLSKRTEIAKGFKLCSIVVKKPWENSPGIVEETLTKGSRYSDPTYGIILKEWEDFLFEFSNSHIGKSFESRADTLFQYKKKGMLAKDIAKEMDISESAVSQWSSKLTKLYDEFTNEGDGITAFA